MLALNSLLRNSLSGGSRESLKTDAQGQTHGLALLEIEVDRCGKPIVSRRGVLDPDRAGGAASPLPE